MKLTPEEIEKIKKFKHNQEEIIDRLGINEFKIQSLFLEKDDIKKLLALNKQDEIRLGKELESKYGDGQIDIDKGEFISRL